MLCDTTTTRLCAVRLGRVASDAVCRGARGATQSAQDCMGCAGGLPRQPPGTSGPIVPSGLQGHQGRPQRFAVLSVPHLELELGGHWPGITCDDR